MGGNGAELPHPVLRLLDMRNPVTPCSQSVPAPNPKGSAVQGLQMQFCSSALKAMGSDPTGGRSRDCCYSLMAKENHRAAGVRGWAGRPHKMLLLGSAGLVEPEIN